MRKNLMEAFRAFYRFALWSLLIGVLSGATAGVLLLLIEIIANGELIRILDFIKGFGFYAFYGVIFGLEALAIVGLPTALVLALLKLTPIRDYKRLPYVISAIALFTFCSIWFSLLDYGQYNFYERYGFTAVAVVVGMALFGAAYRMVSVDARQKSKVKRSEY